MKCIAGTLIDLPTVDPYDLPRRYRSSYDRDEYKRVDYSRSAHSTATPDYSRQDSSDRYRKDYITPEYTKQDSSDRYRDRAYSITRDISYSTSKDSRREPKEASSAVDVALNRTSEAAETAFEIVVMKKEWTAVARSIREIREVRIIRHPQCRQNSARMRIEKNNALMTDTRLTH